MLTDQRDPVSVLFLCTGNSARSQIAEALLTKKGGERFRAGSAGSHPADEVNPQAMHVLRGIGIDWSGRKPKGVDAIVSEQWDIVITLCDRTKESCSTIPGRPLTAHWGIPDPTRFDEAEKRAKAFDDAIALISWRLDLMLALPYESMRSYAMEERLRAFGHSSPPSVGSIEQNEDRTDI